MHLDGTWTENCYPRHRKIFSESYFSKLNLDCNYNSPIALAQNGICFGAEFIGKVL